MTALLFLALALADEPFEPPPSGRPESFRGAVGQFRIQAGARPLKTAVGEPIRYTVRITGDPGVPMLAPPTRPPLEKQTEFTNRFHVEAPEPDSKKDGNVWEFYYLLRPKNVSVTAIPELSFSFFNPRFGNDPRGYQEPSVDPVPIVVTPAEVKPPQVDTPNETRSYPATIQRVAGTEEVLRREHPWTPPAVGVLAVMGLAPPLGALAWLLVWRRLYPDAARRAALRRSRAAKEALKALRGVHEPQQAERVAGIFTVYLAHRFGLPSAAPTPMEAEMHLRGAGLTDELLERTSALLQTCDALRFSARPPSVSGSLTDTAHELVIALEEWTWSSLPS